MLPSFTVDSPDAARTLRATLARFSPMTRNRARRYVSEGRVGQLKKNGTHQVTAQVQGSTLYTVSLNREGQQWVTACSCPMARNCKHAGAAALAWIHELEQGGPAENDDALDEEFEESALEDPTEEIAPLPTLATAFDEDTAPVPPERFREHWQPLLEEKHGRALQPDERAFLGKLADVFTSFRRFGSVRAQEIKALGFNTREVQRGYYSVGYQNWWSEPPKDPLELWQYIAHDIKASGLNVPAFMVPLTQADDVLESASARSRRKTVERWAQRIEALDAAAHAAPLEPPPAVPVDLRLRLTRDRWILETRPTPDASWKPASRTFIDTLGKGSDVMGDPATSPAVWAFVAICQEHYRRHFTLALSPGNPTSRALVHRLLSHRLTRDLVKGSTGETLQFADQGLNWVIEPLDDRRRDYTLALSRPDGTALPQSAVHLGGPPDLYLDDDTVYRGPPPLDGSSAAAAIVPAEVLERPKTLRTLRRLGTKLPEEIAQRLVAIVLHPRIECRLEENRLGEEVLVVELLAVSSHPPVRQHWTPTGWRDPSAKMGTAEESAEARQAVHVFDTPSPERTASYLRDLGVTYEPHDQHWTRRVTKTFSDDFLEWRHALPPDVEVVATGELASLLGGAVRARVDFELLETKTHRDWFDLALALKPEDSTLTPDELALLLKARGKFVRLAGKGWRRLEVHLDDRLSGALESAGFDAASITQAAAAGERHRFHALQLASSGVSELLPEREAAALRARARDMVKPEDVALPASLRAELRPYQRDGFQFLVFLSLNGLGGVLADDMGLGKTLQTLAWLLWLSERQPSDVAAEFLVVCPKSVVANWEVETARFTPALATLRFENTFTFHGTPAVPGRARIVIANYSQLRLNEKFFRAHPWTAVVLDEGQFIKNPSSKVAQTARELRGEHRLVLTGTPIENRLLDLWSLFAFALPGLLGSQASFKRHYADDDQPGLARLRTRVRHFLLRRTKSQVATDLPPRTEEDLVVEMEGVQAKLYAAELKRARSQLLGVQTDREFDQARFNILASLLRLRQICCHPALVDPAQADAPSAKLEALMEHIEELRDEGHQVLVFSQFVEMLNLIRDRLAAAEINHLMLTGQTNNREELVARFQSDRTCTVFLLSLKAAGFGLNLTAAPYVILYDPWWNPAVEAQAIDRAHRIGQSNPVIAYRLVARGTVEEKIRALQRDKASLADAVVQEESLASVMDLDTLKEVLS